MAEQQRVVSFDRLGMSDLAQVGGKNASLGEMIRHLAAEGVVPGGFATTALPSTNSSMAQLRP
jgi:pyruvate,water dikinase